MDVDPRHYESVAVNENDIHSIVTSYLIHNCYKETLESFISCTGTKQPSDYLEDMDKRKNNSQDLKGKRLHLAVADKLFTGYFCYIVTILGIFHSVIEGNVLKAMDLTEQLVPDVLEKNRDLHFDLLSLRFVELVSSRKSTEALEFAQTRLSPFGKEQKYIEKLEDFMALLAYEEPEKSPMFHLLSLEYRQLVADSLNSAILAHANLPSQTAMERLIQQVTIVRQCLGQEAKDGHSSFSLKDFLKT